MYPAFNLGKVFPPPRAGVFARHHRTRAIGAANTGIVAVMQFVVGNFMDPNVGPDILPLPLRERIDFYQLKLLVPLDQLRIGSRGRLVPPDPGEPCVESLEHSGERLHFAQLATLIGMARPQRITILGGLLLRGQQ